MSVKSPIRRKSAFAPPQLSIMKAAAAPEIPEKRSLRGRCVASKERR